MKILTRIIKVFICTINIAFILIEGLTITLVWLSGNMLYGRKILCTVLASICIAASIYYIVDIFRGLNKLIEEL
jgi:hypothetical protein